MSDHDAKPSDDKGKQPVPPQRLKAERLAPWEQPPSQTQPPRQPRVKQEGTGGSGLPKAPILKSPKGYDRDSRVFMRASLHYELPQPPLMKDAIKEKMIDVEPIKPPRPQRPPRIRPQLRRTGGARDLADQADAAWTKIHDDVMDKWASFTDSFDQAKTLKCSGLGNKGVSDLCKDLTAKASAVIDAADRFLKLGVAQDDPPQGRRDLRTDRRRPGLKNLQDEIVPIAAEARKQQKVIADLLGEIAQAPDNLGQALEAKRRGVRFADLKLADYGDDKLDRAKSKEDFAGGQVNKVSKLVYGNETRIFKSEQLTTNSKANQIGIAGIDKSAPRFGNRNIATKAMSNVLGGSVIPDACFTVHDDKIGLLMQAAPGEEMKDFKAKGFNPKPPSADVVASLHAQLNELEWTDMLTGQGDRHDGNYMIDAKASSIKITGIDNDFCFGKNQDDYSKYGSSPDAGKTRGGRRGNYWGYNSAEMPPLIDKKSLDALTGKDFDRDVRPTLKGLLSDEELEASKKRFAQMQAHAQSLSPDYVVTDWKTWRSPKNGEPPDMNATEFLKGNKSITMFQRDFKDLV